MQGLRETHDEGLKGTEKCVLKAHKLTNDALHADASIDTSFSGTTSITVLIRDRTMFVNNVGDSRAIVISKNGDNVLVSPMSSDHTPYRKDERFRVMKYGARILSVDQVQQNEVQINDNWGDITLGDDLDEAGDPPRVWAQNGDFPGTAFTRSLGDQVAEDLGVTAYNGAGQLISTTGNGPTYLTLAGKIVSVEARHAALIRDLISNGSFADSSVVDANGLDVVRTPNEVLTIAGTYLKTKVNASNLPTS